MEEANEGSKIQSENGRDVGEIAATKTWLAREFSIESAFVGVPKLSRVIGLSVSTIYAHMRAGKFPIRYRVINKTPMVSLDDLAAWYRAPAPELLPSEPLPPPSSRVPCPEDGEGWIEALAQRALKEIGAEPLRKRRAFK